MLNLRELVLALIQGVTEFLPISSSAHLLLPTLLLGWPDQGLAFDVAVHFGTLMALIVYFRSELGKMLVAMVGFCLRRELTAEEWEQVRMVGLLSLATLPVVVAGLLLGDFVEARLRSVVVVAWATLGFGIALYLADRRNQFVAGRARLSAAGAVLIGLSQILALIPGASRAGVTLTAGLLLGLGRTAAARFSFLLAIPTIAGAGLLQGMKAIAAPAPADWFGMLLAAGVSGLTALTCIHLFLRLVERVGVLPFVIYRLLLGLVLLWLVT